MSSPYVKLGNKSVDQWKVTELKEELKRRRLTTTGLKQDLVRRLDEAVRIEMQSLEDEENESTQSEVPVENEIADTNISARTENVTDREIDIVEKVDPKAGHKVDGHRESSSEGKVIGSDLVQGTKSTGLEGEQVPQPSVVETTEVDKTAEPAKTSSESNLQDHGTIEDRDATILLNDDGHLQEDAKFELSGPITQSPLINESSTPVVPPNGQNLQGSETQSEAIHSTNQTENDDSSFLQPDSSGQTLKLQVSEVDPTLGFQVTSASVSTESVSIIEKNELKIDVINDNVKLELDAKPETEQSPSGAFPDGGKSHPMDVEDPLDKNDSKDHLDKKDVEEPLDKSDSKDQLDKNDVEEPHDEEPHIEATGGSKVENVDSLKSIDSGDMGPPEKLSLDRSSGDDSMEEDVTESKQMDDKSDSFTENVEKSGTPSAKEEDHVDVVGHDKPVEMKVQPDEMEVTNVENETPSTLTSGKRKFQDKEAVGNNDAVKKVRRWNAEGLKSSEPQSGSITPKGSSEPSFKPTPGTNSLANIEAPKERVVPPSSRPPTNSLRIDRFLRPFTLKAVQELLGKSGTVTSFWMDHIKTHCYVSYSSVEEAVETRNAVYNLQWPPNGGRLLVVEFVDPEDVKSRAEAPLASPATPSTSTTPTQPPSGAQPSPRQQLLKQQMPPLPPPPSLSNPPHVRERLHTPREQPLPARDRLNLPPPPPLPAPIAEKVDPPIVTLDDLFRKTKATPRIYYLPLSDEVVAAKLKTQGKNVTQ